MISTWIGVPRSSRQAAGTFVTHRRCNPSSSFILQSKLIVHCTLLLLNNTCSLSVRVFYPTFLSNSNVMLIVRRVLSNCSMPHPLITVNGGRGYPFASKLVCIKSFLTAKSFLTSVLAVVLHLLDSESQACW